MNLFSKKIVPVTLAAVAVLTACHSPKVTEANYSVIPLPNSIVEKQAQPFVLTRSTVICYPAGNADMERNARFLSDYIQALTGYELAVKTDDGKQKSCIRLTLDSSIPSKNQTVDFEGKTAEGYRLEVGENITITGASPAGVFYGIQVLRKSVPAHAKGQNVVFSPVVIQDAPRFSYRGMMLDVCRHFFTVDEVKRYIDILALHQINRFHWHLSEDQGWRIEIKKYPRLTEVGSKRKETVIGRNSGKYDGKPYGGYFTQEQIKDIVAYAADRYITIVPEIDLPGHMQAALAAYPEFGCTGGPYEVWTQWGVSDNVICAGNEKALTFLEDVLSEVVELFPSAYIHVGGDECPKTRWKECPKCQKRIADEGIRKDEKHTAEEYLQSYVISRMEKFLEGKGRHIIGWDETLEGGLAPNATVMSWRGVGGGIEAAKQKHPVIMTPNSHVYFDYYQTANTEGEPLAIGGYVPVEKVYSLNPTAGIPADGQKYVIGAQANLWTEYIPTFKQVEYMVLPRMAALAEVQWTRPENKNYASFLQRVPELMDQYDANGYNYATHLLDIHATLQPDTKEDALKVTFKTLGKGDIRYTLDGSDPTESSARYDSLQPLLLREDAVIKAAVFRPGGTRSRIFTEQITRSKSSMKPITLKQQPSGGYAFNGAPVLNDGLHGSDNYKTGRWLGFQGRDLDAVIDLKEPTEISKLRFRCNVVKGDWIMGPSGVSVQVSDDGTNFREIHSEVIADLQQEDKDGLYPYEYTFSPTTARYVRVIVRSSKLPQWHPGKGYPAFVFVDELDLY